jgi:hypothetical protein
MDPLHRGFHGLGSNLKPSVRHSFDRNAHDFQPSIRKDLAMTDASRTRFKDDIRQGEKCGITGQVCVGCQSPRAAAKNQTALDNAFAHCDIPELSGRGRQKSARNRGEDGEAKLAGRAQIGDAGRL